MNVYRITATLHPGHDMESIIFMVKASRIVDAISSGIKAMGQLGWKADDYDLAYSVAQHAVEET